MNTLAKLFINQISSLQHLSPLWHTTRKTPTRPNSVVDVNTARFPSMCKHNSLLDPVRYNQKQLTEIHWSLTKVHFTELTPVSGKMKGVEEVAQAHTLIDKGRRGRDAAVRRRSNTDTLVREDCGVCVAEPRLRRGETCGEVVEAAARAYGRRSTISPPKHLRSVQRPRNGRWPRTERLHNSLSLSGGTFP